MFSLSAKGLQRVSEQLESDFTLYINNNPINVSKYIISFFSKKIFRALSLNPSLNSYSIRINNIQNNISEGTNIENGKEAEYIRDIKNLMIGNSIEITKEKARYMEIIGEGLENDELINISVNTILEGEEIDEKNCIERIKRKERNSINFEEEEDYITKHFSEIEIKELEELDIDLLEKILNRKDLMIKSEEELIEKIKSMRKEYRVLIKEVDVTNIGREYLEEYINIIEEENLVIEAWKKLRNKMLNGKNTNKGWISEEKKTFQLQSGKEKEGILRYLFDKCGGNINDKAEVSISGSRRVDARYLGNMNNTSNTNTCTSSPNQFIQYDFYQKRVKLTNYTIYNTSSCKLMHWKVLGSNDCDNWEEIDTQDLTSNPQDISTYNVNTDKSFKYIRFLQTGKNSNNNEHFYYSLFEFFGELDIGKINE